VSNSTKLILFVEDDSADARLTQRALQKTENSAQVFRVENGDDAVKYLEGQAPFQNRGTHPFPYLMLLDIKLPRRSGLEVLQWVRAQEGGIALLPVVMLTSSRHQADVNKAYAYGVNSYLTKPETYSQLTEMMSALQTYWLRHNEEPIIVEPPDA
jgi:CheY-like chemotaxis protein